MKKIIQLFSALLSIFALTPITQAYAANAELGTSPNVQTGDIIALGAIIGVIVIALIVLVVAIALKKRKK